ncbi:MAG: YbhB/YbcL family Raf kinase inhibitor-like protein [Candidatus Zambryskibacteria bacterium]|nr:YbhB/YbcL family Raf kinase inhibitor-like protein [Candidatus Zambryskibacteria bacterium]
MRLSSSAFEHNASIPVKYTCDGEKVTNPPLSISGVPAEAKTLALIMDDPDVPKQLRPDGVFDHWVLFNIPPATQEIPEGGGTGTPGANTAGGSAYVGPCPPSQYEPSEHRYIFKLYALDAVLNIEPGAAKKEVLEAMQNHILAEAELIGRYRRQ